MVPNVEDVVNKSCLLSTTTLSSTAEARLKASKERLQ